MLCYVKRVIYSEVMFIFEKRGVVLKLVFLIGDSAVGKMTVGQELTKITDLRLFHNHIIIEPVIETFGYFYEKAIIRMRDVIFEVFASSDCYGFNFHIYVGI